VRFSEEISSVAAIANDGGPRPSDDLLQRWIGRAQQLEALYSDMLESVLSPGQWDVVRSIEASLAELCKEAPGE
jgi:hypothetical protein